VGEWKDGKPHGQITVTCSDGKILNGEYVYSDNDEPGSLIFPDGSTFLFKDSIGSC